MRQDPDVRGKGITLEGVTMIRTCTAYLLSVGMMISRHLERWQDYRAGSSSFFLRLLADRRPVLGALLASAALFTASSPDALKAQQSARVAPAAVPAAKALSVSLKQYKVVRDPKGGERLIDAAKVVPGDVLEYRATYTNTSAQPITNLVATLPIPAGTQYVPRSAQPQAAAPLAATSDGVFAAEPLMRRVDGQARAIPYGEYRSVRWRVAQVPARGAVSVSTRAKVEVVIPPARPAPPASLR